MVGISWKNRGKTVGNTHLRSYSKAPIWKDAPVDSDPPDADSLYRLSLSGLPFKTAGLRKARLIKNTNFDGVIELFYDEKAGSGQISPNRLSEIFLFDSRNNSDLELIEQLSQLSSYDVYTVRVALRRLGLEVEDHTALQLSPGLSRTLVPHMKSFTRPLIRAVYGEDAEEPEDLRNMVSLFKTPDVELARRNLQRLSNRMRIDVSAIPKFLEDYGDVYLSLAYYQYCLDQSRPQIMSFLDTIEEMQSSPSLRQTANLMAACKSLENKVTGIVNDVGDILEMFRLRTTDMWEQMSEDTFRRMESMIIGYQSCIGGALCIITVKMDAWNRQFPQKGIGGPWSRADFLMTSMRPGLEKVERIDYSDIA
ncbi:MAG: hypothetical protein RH942_08815 [Kiloniellaceae bacterium]